MTFDVTGVLFPNWLTMVVQLCSTLVLFLLCKKLLWTPARNILKARQAKMNADLNEAKKEREEATENLNEAKKHLEDARSRSNEIVDNARKEALNLKEELIKQAKKEANDKLAKADLQIEENKLAAKKELHDEMVDVALAAVSKLLNDRATSSDDEQAIKDYLKENQ